MAIRYTSIKYSGLFLEAFMGNTLRLPVGIENFEEVRKLGFYYIDETRLIEQLLQGWGEGYSFYPPSPFW